MRETGIGIPNPLFFIGVVENNVDERLEGRVQVRAFGVHGTNQQVPTESLPWATLIHGSYDPDAPIPPVNSFVFGFFVDGRDAQQPMILGLIPTQLLEPINPQITGWGAIPARDADILARGSMPNDIGQPRNSRETRGEYIEETYVLQQEANRRRNIPVASINPDDEENTATFSEPAPAYNAEYPFNRVIRSGRNTIELDDTPGSERITIFHQNSGSYISIDSRGTTVHRSMSDTYNINERNYNVYIGGVNTVTIAGDSRVLVQGNKIEEISGDLIQNVRGNHLLSVAGQSNINVGEDIQMRAAKIRMEANVENINLKAGRDIKIESADFMQIKSGATINMESTDAININAAAENVNIQAGGDFNFKAARAYITAEGALDLYGGHVKAGGGTKVSINADIVAIDDIVQLANGSSMAPEGAGDAATAEAAEGTEMPEPVSRGISATAGAGTPSLGSVGYASADDPIPDPAVDAELNDAARENNISTEDTYLDENLNRPSVNDPEVQARLERLRNDPDFMREFNATVERFPNLTADQLWGTIAGESGGDPTKINESNRLYGGLFQLGQASVSLSPQDVASRSPAGQMQLYRGYLESINYVGGSLGMYQAAPSVVGTYYQRTGQLPPDNLLLYIPNQYNQQQIQALQDAGYITDYASRQFGDVVLQQNSAGPLVNGRNTVITPGTVWVEEVSPELQRLGIPGVITAGQVNRYYEER